MKLIDLLVQELPRLGGWPVGADRYCAYDGQAYAYADHGRVGVERTYLSTPEYLCETVMRDEYEAALAASQKPGWSGKGLPPVGCECEWQDRNTKQWNKVSVVYASEWVTVIREDKIADPVELAIENYGDEARRKFRPIRTEAERKRDEAISAMRESLGHAAGIVEVANIYRAIAAGKIPGVKLE